MIEPGSIIGVFGSGQLGRMLTLEARKMGYRVATFSPQLDSPTGQVADFEVVSSYEDLERAVEFARLVNVLTFEFENIPYSTIAATAEITPVFPSGEALYIAQNRLREKKFLQANGFPIAPFCAIETIADLKQAVNEIGVPGVLKTAGFGYDGKGQAKIFGEDDIESAFEGTDSGNRVYEAFVEFEREVSVICTRDQPGNFSNFGLIENEHRNHILDVSFAPSSADARITQFAIEIARGIAETLEFVGTLCVEFFQLADGSLMVNEIAPRPHNSGHLTFQSSCLTSQFEQQIRAVCGLPMGSTEFVRPVAMVNLLGDLWENGQPNWHRALSDPNVKLHLYGKQEARAGRKMGHLTAISETSKEARRAALAARAAL